MQALKKGDRLGRYVLDRPLGAGGMGSVWVAIQDGLGRRVALKVMHATFAMDATVAARFQREAQIAASFNHPSIVPVTDFGVHEGRPFLVMDLLEGESMEQLLTREGRIGIERCAFLAVQVLAGLEAAHAKGVVHRDLKPDNIFVTSSSGVGGIARILDFGIARLSDATAPKMTGTGQVLGTPAYMAPEQAKGLPADERSDLYSVGVILYEALSGRVPFEADNYHQLMFAVVDGAPPPLAELRPDLPPEFVAVVERAMAKAPDARFDSALAMREALLPFSRNVSMAPVDAPKVTGPKSDTDPLAATMAVGEDLPALQEAGSSTAPAKRSGLTFVGIALLVVIGALGVTFALRSPANPPVPNNDVSTAVTPPPVVEQRVEQPLEQPVETPEIEAPIETPEVEPPVETPEVEPRVETPQVEAPAETPERPSAPPRMRTTMSHSMMEAPPSMERPLSTAASRPGYAMVQCGSRQKELRVVREGDRVIATSGTTNRRVQDSRLWRDRASAHSLALARCYMGEPIDPSEYINVVLSGAGRITDVSFAGLCPVERRVKMCVARVLRSVDYSDVVQSGGPASFSFGVR